MNKIYLGGGCFWCLEAVYQRLKGVETVVSGYGGGELEEPSYEQVSSGESGHAEIVEITYNESIVSLETLLDVFWQIHDPTTINRQGNDVGPQYRSIILFTEEDQKTIIKQSIEETASKIWEQPIVTEVEKLSKFFPAEDYHQDYFNNNPGNGYCQVVINPKLEKLNSKFSDLLEPSD